MNICFAMLAIFLCAVMYFLYGRGIAVSKNIRAVLFMSRPGKSADKVDLDSCTGWVQRVGRFHESSTYELILNTQLSKGEAEFSLLDRKKRPLLKLNRRCPSSRVELYVDSRYYLRCLKRKNMRCLCIALLLIVIAVTYKQTIDAPERRTPLGKSIDYP